MIGGFNKLRNLPPAVLWSVLMVVIVGVGVGGFFIFNNYIYNEKQGDGSDNINGTCEVAFTEDTDQWEEIKWRGYGIGFSFLVPPEIKETINQSNSSVMQRGGIAAYQERTLLTGLNNISAIPNISVAYFYNDDPDLETWVNKFVEQQQLGQFGTTFTKEQTSISQNVAYVIDVNHEYGDRSIENVYTFMQKGQFVYKITMPHEYWISESCGYAQTLASDDSVFRNILMSFRFLDPIVESDRPVITMNDWVSHTFKNFGITIKYPKEFDFPGGGNETLASQQYVDEWDGYGGIMSFQKLSDSIDGFIADYNNDNPLFQITAPVEDYIVNSITFKKLSAGTDLGLHIDFLASTDSSLPSFIIGCDLDNPIHTAMLDGLTRMDSLRILDADDFVKYKDTAHKFSLQYPSDYKVSQFVFEQEVTNSSDARPILHFYVEREDGEGFRMEVYASPYAIIQSVHNYPALTNSEIPVNKITARLNNKGDFVIERNGYTYIINGTALSTEKDQLVLDSFCILDNPNDSCDPVTLPTHPWDISLTYRESGMAGGLENHQVIYYRESANPTHIYRTDLDSGVTKDLFSVAQESQRNENYYSYFTPSISSDGTRIAYTDERGLIVRQLSDNSETILISKESDPPENSEEAPTWSIEPTWQTYTLRNPLWSYDDEYLSFVQGHYEGSSTGILNLLSREYFTVMGPEDRAAGGGHNLIWAPTKTMIAIPASGGYEGLGLFVTQISDLKKVNNIAPSDASVTNASFSSNSETLVYTYTVNNEDTDKFILTVSDTKGDNVRTTTSDSRFINPFFMPNSNSVVALQDSGDAYVLNRFDMSSDNAVGIEIARLPGEFETWSVLQWTPEGYLVLEGESNSLGLSKLLILDLENQKVIYQSGMDSIQVNYLGLTG